MTASILALLQPMKDRLTAATPGPWKADRGGDFQSIKLHNGSLWIDVVDGSHNAPPLGEWIDSPDIDLIEAAPTDQAKLIAAIERVESLAAAWQARGEHLRKFAETVPEDVREALDQQGADTLWHANLVRAALTQALGGDGA